MLGGDAIKIKIFLRYPMIKFMNFYPVVSIKLKSDLATICMQYLKNKMCRIYVLIKLSLEL